jgi:hypothetical protein
MKYTFPTLTEGRVYLVMGPNVWGKNAIFTKAVENAKKEGGRLDRYLVFNVPADASVDDLEVVRVGDFTR